MFALTKQVQVACDFAKGTCMRLAGKEVPSFDDNESSFADLRARIDKTIALLARLMPPDRWQRAAKSIEPRHTTRTQIRANLLAALFIAQLFLHVTTAYNILRTTGGLKKDFMGHCD